MFAMRIDSDGNAYLWRPNCDLLPKWISPNGWIPVMTILQARQLDQMLRPARPWTARES